MLRPARSSLASTVRAVCVLATAVATIFLVASTSNAQQCTAEQNAAIEALARACRDTNTIGAELRPRLSATFTASGPGWSISRPATEAGNFDGGPHLEALVRAACSPFKVADRSGLWVAAPTITERERACTATAATVTWTIEGIQRVHLPDASSTDPYHNIRVTPSAAESSTATLTFDATGRLIQHLDIRGTARGPAPTAESNRPGSVTPLNNDECGLVYGTVTVDGHAPANGTVLEAVDSGGPTYPSITMNGTTSNYSFGAGIVATGTYTLRANGVLASQDCGACASGAAHWCNATVTTGGGGCNPTVTIQHAMRRLDLDVAFAVVMPLGLVLGRRRKHRA